MSKKVIIIYGALIVVGVGAYFLLRKKPAVTPAKQPVSTKAPAAAPQPLGASSAGAGISSGTNPGSVSSPAINDYMDNVNLPEGLQEV